MSFLDELFDARRRTQIEAEQARIEAVTRQAQQDKQIRQEYDRARQDLALQMAQWSPTVEALLVDMGRATWGDHNFGIGQSIGIAFPDRADGSWTVGYLDVRYGTRSGPTSSRRLPCVEVPPSAWNDGRRELYDYTLHHFTVHWVRSYDQYHLEVPKRFNPSFGSDLVDKTEGITVGGLKDLLKRDFVRGPHKTTYQRFPPYNPPAEHGG